jgi:hypothetical protein
MALPQVEILPTDTLQKAEERVEKAFESLGLELVGFENLNTVLPCSDSCHFFHVELDERPHVIVVSAAPWDEEAVITILNVLLELRIDPDPPGSRLRIGFFCAHPVPDVLALLFADHGIADFECSAALVARFGHELEPTDCTQLAAAATFLGREHLGVHIEILDSHGAERIMDAVCEHLRDEELPSEPLNSLVLYGCLFGEILRTRLGCPSRWASIRQFEPWPGLVFSPCAEQSGSSGETQVDSEASAAAVSSSTQAGDSEGDSASASADSSARRSGGGGSQGFGFNPVAHVIHLWETGDRTALFDAIRGLEERCR